LAGASFRSGTAPSPCGTPPYTVRIEGEGDTNLFAPMPGMVVRYEVREGSRVAKGDVVVILEAMKMENFITSPRAGVVGKALFREGDSVRKGDVLAVIV
ncbi:MAG TPA: acetyl-CoA carboxylase biotin carboxyl carrier protein subunit, partial [Desulfomonilia bacterium]|nr:acetyl-CoA carboxylase biotin carboxyl carrier protein subunit [Desulfomonilia bacterium]